ADRLITDEDLDGIVELGAGTHVDVLVVERLLQEFLQLDDFGVVHDWVLMFELAGNLVPDRALTTPDAAILSVTNPAWPLPRRQALASCTSTIWSMTRAGCAQPASPITLAGTPATVVRGGTSLSTTEPAPMREQSPTRMLPSTVAPAPISTPFPILG